MLTKNEHKWLKKRPDYLDLTVSPYAPVYRMWARNSVWRLLLYDVDFFGEKTRVINEAAEFELMVERELLWEMQEAYCDGWNDHSRGDCDYLEPIPSQELRRARLAVEEKLENEQHL